MGFGRGFSSEHNDNLRLTGRNLLRDADGQCAFGRNCGCERDNAHICTLSNACCATWKRRNSPASSEAVHPPAHLQTR